MIAESLLSKFVTKQQGQAVARGTGMGSLAVAQVEPEGFEVGRAGRRFYLGFSAAVTGIAPVQALPTTAAQWVLWNVDAARAAIFEELGMILTSGTPGAGGVLYGALVQAPAQIVPGAAGLSSASRSNGGLATKLVVKSGVTITSPAAPTWQPIAENDSANVAAFPGSSTYKNRDLKGRWIVPPGQGLALAVVSPAGATPLFAPWGTWAEAEADLE